MQPSQNLLNFFLTILSSSEWNVIIASTPSLFKRPNALSSERIFREYGEEKFAPVISRAIVRAREQKRIETTLELAEIIKSAMPAAAKRDGHPARRTFQAIRIYINGELDGLSQAVTDMFDCLDKGGRVSIITFHSLEDRIVKAPQTAKDHMLRCGYNPSFLFPLFYILKYLISTYERGGDAQE